MKDFKFPHWKVWYKPIKGSSSKFTPSGYDSRVVLFGDLNYRISIPDKETRSDLGSQKLRQIGSL
ncbi:hypothetical protein M8C21_014049 [Ambrosia artemisiifolia]|uniref:Uncharacterized protein n=1 Tax=Ambrosia artemisiifolia TaxID=4212 RepID=A0AAD5D8T1_AMBAR|nr:hypothetical protein M8C21_014049 [Ambrosia artemisiifolia]